MCLCAACAAGMLIAQQHTIQSTVSQHTARPFGNLLFSLMSMDGYTEKTSVDTKWAALPRSEWRLSALFVGAADVPFIVKLSSVTNTMVHSYVHVPESSFRSAKSSVSSLLPLSGTMVCALPTGLAEPPVVHFVGLLLCGVFTGFVFSLRCDGAGGGGGADEA